MADIEVHEIQINTPFIELDKLLKRENLAETGGAARQLVVAGEVSVNGVLETRKRRKLYPGDVVQVGEIRLVVRTEVT